MCNCISVIGTDYQGSCEERVVITFSQHLSPTQKNFVDNKLNAAECRVFIYSTRWRNNNVLVVEVFRKSIQDCSRIDVTRAVEKISHYIPTPVNHIH